MKTRIALMLLLAALAGGLVACGSMKGRGAFAGFWTMWFKPSTYVEMFRKAPKPPASTNANGARVFEPNVGYYQLGSEGVGIFNGAKTNTQFQ